MWNGPFAVLIKNFEMTEKQSIRKIKNFSKGTNAFFLIELKQFLLLTMPLLKVI